MTAVPPNLTFRLPAGWRPVPAEMAGAPGLVFIGVHETPDGGFTANVTVGVQASAGPGLVPALAAEAVRRIEATERDVVVQRQDVLGEEPALGLGQQVTFTTDLDGRPVPLVQAQVFLAAADVEDPQRQVVWTITFTATAAQAPALAPDVEELVRSVRAGLPA